MPYLLIPATNTGNDLTGGIFYANSSPGDTLTGLVNGTSYRVYALDAGPNSTPNGPVPSTTLKAGTLSNPPISARLGVLDNPSSRVFINYFKQSYGWRGANFSTSWEQLVAAGHMTAGGQLISIMPGTNGFYARLFEGRSASTGATGRWRLRWEGNCTIDFNGGSNVDRSVANQITFNFVANGSNFADIYVRTINSAGGQVRNFSLVQEEDWADFAAGEIFRKQYLDEIRNYRTLRFDEWIGILRSESEGGLRITNWASRALPTDEMFHRFVPYEYMAALCNKIGADMWVCMPTAATNDHFTQAATLIRSLMPAPRHVYAEYSTKTWDFAGTPQAHYCAEQGRIAFGTTANPTQTEFRNWYGLRATQMAQLWRAVWGNDTRLHTVVQHQADWVGGEADILVAPMWQSRSGQNGLPTYVAPHSVIDMLTVHAQIDGGMAYGGRVTQIDNWRTTLSQSEAFNRMRDQMLTGQYWGADRTIAEMTPKFNHYKTVCNGYGMELGSYEVGNHLNGVGGSAATTAFIQAFSVSTQMGQVYTATFNAIRTAGFNGPLAMSVEVREPDQNINHGLQRYLGDYNPAWTAVNAINVVNNGPTGRGQNDFIGPYDLA